MQDHDEELFALVEAAADDIIYDHVNYDTPVKTEIRTKEIERLGEEEDDGVVFGDYRIIVNGGQFIIGLRASGVFRSFVDTWNWASESHSTRDVYFEELQDFQYEITDFTVDDGKALDKIVDGEIDSSKEDRR
jgi:hypothetical protein